MQKPAPRPFPATRYPPADICQGLRHAYTAIVGTPAGGWFSGHSPAAPSPSGLSDMHYAHSPPRLAGLDCPVAGSSPQVRAPAG